MNRWLLGIALVLTLWVAYQAQRGIEPEIDPAEPEPVDLPELSPFAIDEFPPLESFAAMIERPLFSPDRRPGEEVHGDPAASAPSALSDPDSIDGIVLSGVSIIGGRKLALLLDDETGRFVRLAEGEELGGWRVESIEASRVSLVNDDEDVYQLELRPEYVHQPPTASEPLDDRESADDEDDVPLDLRALLEDEERVEDEDDD